MPRHVVLIPLLLLSFAACKAKDDGDPEPAKPGGSGGTPAASDDAGKSGSSSGNPGGGQGGTSSGGGGAGGSSDPAHPNDAGQDAGSDPAGQGGGGGSDPEEIPDAGMTPDPDAAVEDAGGGAPDSCCVAHDTPGCGNADLQVCVCEKLSSCCTEKWAAPCVLIVEQKYCQTGVRDCVCGSGTDQWMQTSCCESAWSNFCDQVAESKCDAVRGCF